MGNQKEPKSLLVWIPIVVAIIGALATLGAAIIQILPDINTPTPVQITPSSSAPAVALEASPLATLTNIVETDTPAVTPTSRPTSTELPVLPTQTIPATETATPTVETSLYRVSLDDVDYYLVDTTFQGSRLEISFIAINRGADKNICLYFTSSLTDSDGMQHRQSDRTNGRDEGGSDCFNIALPYNVPARLGLIFDTLSPSTSEIPFVEVVIQGEGRLQFRDVQVPFSDSTMLNLIPSSAQIATELGQVSYQLVEATYSNSELSVWFLAENSGPDNNTCIYFTSYLIDVSGIPHRQSDRSDGSQRGGLDCFNINLPNGVPTRFGLIFDSVVPSINLIPFIAVVIQGEGQAQFRDIPVPFNQ